LDYNERTSLVGLNIQTTSLDELDVELTLCWGGRRDRSGGSRSRRVRSLLVSEIARCWRGFHLEFRGVERKLGGG